MERECRCPDGIGGGSGDETLGSVTGRGRHLLRPAGNEAGWGKSSRCGGSLCPIGVRMSGTARQEQSFRKSGTKMPAIKPIDKFGEVQRPPRAPTAVIGPV